MKRIYLDVCCLNRPFDDQEQDRIHLESEAVRFIFKHIRNGGVIWVSSSIVDLELSRTPYFERRRKMELLTVNSAGKIKADVLDIERAEVLELLGFDAMDALHVACAERAEAEILLTTDDLFLKKGILHSKKLKVVIQNPVIWLQGGMK